MSYRRLIVVEATLHVYWAKTVVLQEAQLFRTPVIRLLCSSCEKIVRLKAVLLAKALSYGSRYSRMDQVKFVKTAFKNLYLVHSWIPSAIFVWQFHKYASGVGKFLICNFAAPRSTFGSCQGGNFTHPLSITTLYFVHFDWRSHSLVLKWF